MTTPTARMEISRTTVNGKPAIVVVVRESRSCAGLSDLLDRLGVVCTPHLANHRSVVCATPEALDAIRQPLQSYCDASGYFVRPVEA